MFMLFVFKKYTPLWSTHMCKKSVSNNISLKEVWQSLHSEHQTEHRRHGGGDCPKVSLLFEAKKFSCFSCQECGVGWQPVQHGQAVAGQAWNQGWPDRTLAVKSTPSSFEDFVDFGGPFQRSSSKWMRCLVFLLPRRLNHWNDVLVSFSQKHENGPVMISFTYGVIYCNLERERVSE